MPGRYCVVSCMKPSPLKVRGSLDSSARESGRKEHDDQEDEAKSDWGEWSQSVFLCLRSARRHIPAT